MRFIALALCVVFLQLACSDSDAIGESNDDAGVATTSDSSGEVGFPDVAVEPGVAPQSDTSEKLSGWDCAQEGAPGCPCEDNSDCTSEWCVTTGDGSICSETCLLDCPIGWKCAAVTNTGSDATYICLPLHTNLCRPCETGADCEQLGETGGYCLEAGVGLGSFCGAQCSDKYPCPEGYSCQSFDVGAADPVDQCWPDDEVCECNNKAVKEGAWTPCSVTTEFGTCGGSLGCETDGTLGECDAPEATAEVCNQLDDDCDGQVDEDTCEVDLCADLPPCDDQIPCTVDSCDPATGCVHVPDDGACDDGVDCTASTCDGALGCVAVVDHVLCDDGLGCTADSCDAQSGCSSVADDSFCNDGVACTTDSCDPSEGCVHSALDAVCEDSVACTVDTCDLVLGCMSMPDNSLCDDSIACTGNQCDPLTGCLYSPDDSACDDFQECTEDSCVEQGCVHIAVEGECSDGNPCTSDDHCEGASCVGELLDCADDGNPCTLESCDPDSAECIVSFADGQGCDDGDVCTFDDQCNAGVCAGNVAAACDGSEVLCNFNSDAGAQVECPIRMVRAGEGEPKPEGLQLELIYPPGLVLTGFSDGEICEVIDQCTPYLIPSLYSSLQSGHGVFTSPPSIDDWDGQGEVLVVGLSAVSPINDAWLTADGIVGDELVITARFDVLTPSTAEEPNLVKAGSLVVGTSFGAPLKSMVDSSLIVVSAYPVSCAGAGESCDDLDACTTTAKCVSGACVGSDPLSCDDSDPCTVDSCDPQSGCVFESLADCP